MSAVLQIGAIDQSLCAEAARVTRPLNVIIAGNPNAGKTSLFNTLTGLRQKVANYPGVTVESKSGRWTISADLPAAQLIDLPGLYSLDATSLDERIASEILLNQSSVDADVIIIVVDATNLVRNLYLAMQLIETGQPIVIALTMFDLAKRSKLKINIERLSAELGVPVVPVIAKQRRGLDELGRAVLDSSKSVPLVFVKPQTQTAVASTNRQSNLIRRYALIERIVSEAVETNDSGRPGLS